MKNILSKLSLKVGTTFAVAMFFSAVLIVGAAPSVLNHTKAESCSPVYTSPIFNPYPVMRNSDGSFVNSAGSDCTDYPVLSGGVTTGISYNDNITANVGDTIQLRVYVHNGAATGSNAKMQGAAYSVNLDSGSGTQHTITARLTAGNAAEKDGSMVVNTPDGASLQLVSGNLSSVVTSPGESSGSLNACFEFSQQFYITIKVVGQTATGQNTITAIPGGQFGSQCLRTGTAKWTNASDVKSVEVTVQSITSNSSVNSMTGTGGAPNTQTTTDWLTPGDTYQYILYNTTGGQHTELARTTEVVPALNCGSTPPPVTPVVTLTASPNPVCIGSNTTYAVTSTADGTIIWNSTFNSTNTGESNSYNNQNLTLQNGKYVWSGVSDVWSDHFHSNNSKADVGTWTKTVSVNGTRSNTVTFQVKDCSTPPPVVTFTATATATASATASANCANGTSASATASASASATATSSTSQQDAQNQAQSQAQSQAQAKANAQAQASASVQCPITPPPVVTFTATATATASATASANCANGTSASATASASASATATSSTSQQDAQNQAQSQAQSQAQAKANAQAQASASVQCPITPPACVSNSNFALNASAPAKNGSVYSVTLTWSSTGGHQIKITQVNPGSSYENTITVGNSSGSHTVSGLLAASTYIFKMYDVSCDHFLTSVQVVTPSNPGQLTCSVQSSTINSGSAANFTAQGGTSPYSWSGDGSPASGSGASYNPSYTNTGTSSVNHGVSVASSDGQTANCSVVVNPAPQQNGQLTLTKQVKNLGPSGTTLYAESVQAQTGDTVRYLVTVTNNSSVTINNVSVVDTQGSNVGNVTTAGSNGSAVSTSGNLQSALNFGSLAGGSSVTITYTLPVNISNGSINNTATVSASNANSASDSATVNVSTISICTSNSNFALNASAPAKNGSVYSVTLTWSSTGGHQIKITQVNPGSSYENTITVGNSSGSHTVSGLLAASTYIFKMYDVSCDHFLTSVQVVTPSNPGQLTCSVQSSTINSGSAANFTAQGGTSPYSWSGDGSPASGSGASYNPSYTNTGTSSVNHGVSVASSDGQTANCSVVVNPAPQPVNSGDCNNSSSSCNNNTNTNTSSNGNGNNNSNQNNNSNVNGDNNVVTQTNNNCVNNSCNNTTTTNNVVYIRSNGNVVPANQFSQLSITKSVRNSNSGSFSNSVSANNGDTVQFQIVVSNSGSATANNVRVTDSLPSGLNLVSGSVSANGSNVTDSNLYNGMYLGNLSPGQSQTITFSATVSGNGSTSIQNTANATSDNAGSVQASAWVFVNGNGNVLGGSVNLTYSKSAFNKTKNQNATAVDASREDYITYTLTVSNSGNQPATNFIITDDLSQVLPYADFSDYGGGSLNGNMITFPGITVPANGSVTRSFEVRIKYGLSNNLSYVMTNTYGNTVTIRINTPQVLGAFVAPKTGADTNAFVLGGLLTAAFTVYKKKNVLMKLIFN